VKPFQSLFNFLSKLIFYLKASCCMKTPSSRPASGRLEGLKPDYAGHASPVGFPSSRYVGVPFSAGAHEVKSQAVQLRAKPATHAARHSAQSGGAAQVNPQVAPQIPAKAMQAVQRPQFVEASQG
jgi:hypothetical protein